MTLPEPPSCLDTTSASTTRRSRVARRSDDRDGDETGRLNVTSSWRLHAVSGPRQGEVFQLKQRNILGRDTDCEIQVLSEGVSRQHAAVVANDDGEPYLMDLASKNGTFVDGKPILRIRLEHGMSFRLSSSEFIFSIEK